MTRKVRKMRSMRTDGTRSIHSKRTAIARRKQRQIKRAGGVV